MREKLNNVVRTSGMAVLLMLFSCLIPINAKAAEAAQIVSARSSGQEVYLYIKGIESAESSIKVQIGNNVCDNVQAADIVNTNMPVRTFMLLDNSQSLYKRYGNQAKELMKEIIASHIVGEEFKLGVFTKVYTELSDYTADYDALAAQIDSIEFENESSYLSDMLYELLNPAKHNGEANEYRFIIITDGADDPERKYTQTEISELIKSAGVVIHTVGVKGSNNASQLETLFSYSRFSGGTYALVDSNGNISELKESMNGDYNIKCIKVMPDSSILDGSRKEVKVTFGTEGAENVLTASVQMPFGNGAVIPQKEEPAPETTEKPAPIKPSALPTISATPTPKSAKAGMGILPIILAILAVLIIAMVVIVVIIRKKKKKESVAITATNKTDEANQKTELLKDETEKTMLLNRGGDDSGNTMRLWGSGSGQSSYYITITNTANVIQSFKVPIKDRITVGRDSGDIVLSFDKAVSHRHCEFIKKGNLYYVNDLGSSNGTYYQGNKVFGETAIVNDGIIEIGSNKYKITIEG